MINDSTILNRGVDPKSITLILHLIYNNNIIPCL